MQHRANEPEHKHFPELMRRSNVYDTMPRELLVHRLDILEGFILGQTGEPAPLVGMPGEEEADFLEDGESGLAPDDEAELSEMAEDLLCD
jgi:hypothetical protein